jgi:hypothetical protein
MNYSTAEIAETAEKEKLSRKAARTSGNFIRYGN